MIQDFLVTHRLVGERTSVAPIVSKKLIKVLQMEVFAAYIYIPTRGLCHTHLSLSLIDPSSFFSACVKNRHRATTVYQILLRSRVERWLPILRDADKPS
jgi:hypothetical protein